MSRYLKLEIKIADHGDLIITVVEQTHRGLKFTPTGCVFTASNGFRLRSQAAPGLSMDKNEPVLFVQGNWSSLNNNPVLRRVGDNTKISNSQWVKLLTQAVAEYNEAFKPAKQYRYLKRNIKLVRSGL